MLGCVISVKGVFDGICPIQLVTQNPTIHEAKGLKQNQTYALLFAAEGRILITNSDDISRNKNGSMAV